MIVLFILQLLEVTANDVKIIATGGTIYQQGAEVRLECQVPPRTTAITWYHGSRILGTSTLNQGANDGSDSGSKYTAAPMLHPWDLDYVSEPYILTTSFNPKEQFDQLVSQSSTRRKKQSANKRRSRSTSSGSRFKGDFNIPSLSYPTLRFSQNKIVIAKIDETIEGAISCVAKLRKNAIASNPIYIQIAKIDEFSTLGPLSIKSRLNSSALLHCPSPNSVPPANIEWFKMTRSGKHKLDDARYVTSNLGQTLVIKSITNDDEGHYTCTATNTLVGKTVKLEASKELVIVSRSAENRFESFDIQTSTGAPKNELLLGSCGLNSKWYFQNERFNNERIRKSARFGFMKFSFVNGALMLKEIRPKYKGKYSCKDTTLNNTMEYNVQVAYAPIFKGKDSTSMTIEGSKETTLQCPDFSAFPTAKINWKLNGREISETESKLKISGTSRYSEPSKYSRIYQCFVENDEGVASALINVHIKNKKSIPDPDSESQSRKTIQPQFEYANCVQQQMDKFEISFGWKSQLISPIGFYYSIFRQDKEQQMYNPYKLYHPNSKPEHFIDGRSRSTVFTVAYPGNYIISLRSDDHNGLSGRLKESTKNVKCINRPIVRPSCKKSPEKFVQEMPKVRNVTIQYKEFDTQSSAILVEWDVSKYMKMSPSIWDRFEVQVRINNEWKSSLNRLLNSTYENAYHQKTHFAMPYKLSELGNGNWKFRLRRLWTRQCMRRKVSSWVHSQSTNITQLQTVPSDTVATLDQLGTNSVVLSLTSKAQRLESYRICWKPEVHGAVVSKEYTCHETPMLDVYEIKFEISNLDSSYQIWTFTVTDVKDKNPPVLKTTRVIDQQPEVTVRTGVVEDKRYRIDAYKATRVYDVSICSFPDIGTNALHGSIIGILAVFLIFCIVVIIFICRMRNRKRESEEPVDKERTPPPRYSQEDHELFNDDKLDTSRRTSFVKCTLEDKFNQYPTRVDVPSLSTFKENLKDYNSLSTIPYQGTLQTRSEKSSQRET